MRPRRRPRQPQQRGPRNARRRAAFTLIEALVAIVLVVLGIVGVFGGIASINRADYKAREAELLQRLAAQKLSEIQATSDDPQTAETNGDFEEAGYPDVTWTADVETTSTQDLEKIIVTATRDKAEQSLTALVYVRPQTATTGTAGAAGTAGAGQ